MIKKTLLNTLILCFISSNSCAESRIKIIEGDSPNIVNSMEKDGYVEGKGSGDSTYIDILLKIGRKEENPFSAIENNKYDDPYDTDLKSTLKEVPLTFNFKEFNDRKVRIIGYAPAGSMINKKWTGLGIYLDHQDIGGCNFVISDANSLRASVEIPRGVLKKDVKNNATTYLATKNKNGYLYSLHWYNDKYFYSLECAKENFDPDMNKDMISFSKKIDQGN